MSGRAPTPPIAEEDGMCPNRKPHPKHSFPIYRWFTKFWFHCPGRS